GGERTGAARGDRLLDLALDEALPALRLGLGDEPVAHPEEDDGGQQHGGALESLARRRVQAEDAREQVRRGEAGQDAQPGAGPERPDEGQLAAAPHVGQERTDDENDLEALAQDDARRLDEPGPGATARVEEAERRVEMSVQLGDVVLERRGDGGAGLAQRAPDTDESLL